MCHESCLLVYLLSGNLLPAEFGGVYGRWNKRELKIVIEMINVIRFPVCEKKWERYNDNGECS